MSRLSVALKGLLCFLFSLTAPFMVPLALLFTKRDAKNLAWSWYDTPDEKEFIGLYEKDVKRLYDKYGWFIAAWNWFGWRNRGHGFESLFSRGSEGHWPEIEGSVSNADGFFLDRIRFWKNFVFVNGWQVYVSNKYPTGFEYRPKFSIKYRKKK